MSELVARWVTDPETVRDEDGSLRFWPGVPVLLTALGMAVLPAAVAVLVLLGVVS